MLETLENSLEDIDNISDKKIILGGDLSLLFDCNLEACGDNPVSKKKSLTKFIEIKETPNLCSIFRKRNPTFKRYTFRQNNLSCQMFYITCEKNPDILASFVTDHSLILF